MRIATLLAAAGLFVVLATSARPARAQEPAGQAVEQGREALERAGNFPWYDSETDSLRRIEVNSEPAPAPPTQLNSGRSRNPNPAAPMAPKGLSPFLLFLQWAIPIVLLAVLVGLIVYAVRYMTGGSIDIRGRGDEDDDPRGQIDRIENLPFRMKRTISDLLAEARRCYEEGNFNEAIIYLYSYELVHLDKRHLIRLTKGKTNRQYVREVKPKGGISSVLANTMLAFEEVFFGQHDLPRRRFETCWEQLDEFHQMVDQHTAA